MTPQQRRALLEGLLGKLDGWHVGLILFPDADGVLRDVVEKRGNLMDMVAGALLGPLDDDAAWAELLTKLLQEVVDDGE